MDKIQTVHVNRHLCGGDVTAPFQSSWADVGLAGVVLYLRQLRPDIVGGGLDEVTGWGTKLFYVSLILGTIVVGAGLSLVADDNPDGLEWSYSERPDQPDFESVVSNESAIVERADELQVEYSLLPDYSIGSEDAGKGWTSFAGVVGAVLTMAFVWGAGAVINKRGVAHASRAH